MRPVGELLHLAGDGVQAEQARPALASRLVGEVAHHAGGLSQPARVRGQRRDQARADAGAQGGQAGGGERQPAAASAALTQLPK